MNKTNIKCLRAAVNPLGFRDVLAIGIRQIEDKQLPIVRYRKLLRNGRKRKLHEYMCDSIKMYDGKKTELPEVESELKKLKDMTWS